MLFRSLHQRGKGEALIAMIDGWEEMLPASEGGETGLRTYAEGRGGGLFRALDASDQWAAASGAAWALWDLAGQVDDAVLRDQAMDMGREALSTSTDAAGQPKALRMLMQLVRRDLQRGSAPPRRFTAGQYLRLLRASLTA